VTGPGTASCSSDFPWVSEEGEPLSWLLPLPATSWKHYRDLLVLVGAIRRAPRRLRSRMGFGMRGEEVSTKHTGIIIFCLFVCLLG